MTDKKMPHTDARVVIVFDEKHDGVENRATAQNELLRRGWRPEPMLQMWTDPSGVSCTLEAAVLKEKINVPTDIRIF